MQDQWVVKDMNDGFKVVALGYCDESDHMYELGKTHSILKRKGFVAIIGNANDTNML
jgi:hypothetical protein